MPDIFSPDIMIIGGAHIDRIGRSTAKLEPEQSNPGTLRRIVGGVAGNVARALATLDWSVALSTISGKDSDAELLHQELAAKHIDLSLVDCHASLPSATYTAIEDRNGSLIAAIADMNIYDRYSTDQIRAVLSALTKPTWIMADTNLPQEALMTLAAQKGPHRLAVVAVSGPKANRAADMLGDIDLLFCNQAEAAILADEYADLDALPAILMEEGVASGVITKGSAGLTAWVEGSVSSLPAPPVRVKSSNGAGDCLTACVMHALLDGKPLPLAVRYGMAGASLALMSEQTVPDILSRPMLEACLADTPQA